MNTARMLTFTNGHGLHRGCVEIGHAADQGYRNFGTKLWNAAVYRNE